MKSVSFSHGRRENSSFVVARGQPYLALVIGGNMKIDKHSALSTPFWQAAYQSLPQQVRHRYLVHFERAERWELGLDATIEAASRAKAALARLLHAPAKPRSAH
jgi:hypothetical protein